MSLSDGIHSTPCISNQVIIFISKSIGKAKRVHKFSNYIFIVYIYLVIIYLFGVLRCFQHYTGHITTGSWKGRGNQYIQFVRVLYCKLPTNSKQLPAFPLETVPGIEPRPQRWEARGLPFCHRGPLISLVRIILALGLLRCL